MKSSYHKFKETQTKKDYENPFAFLLFWISSPRKRKLLNSEEGLIKKLEKLLSPPIDNIPLYYILNEDSREIPIGLEKISNKHTQFVYSKGLNAFQETDLERYLSLQKAKTLIALGRGIPWIFENAKIIADKKNYNLRIIKEGLVGSPKEMVSLQLDWYEKNSEVYEFPWLRKSLVNSLNENQDYSLEQ